MALELISICDVVQRNVPVAGHNFCDKLVASLHISPDPEDERLAHMVHLNSFGGGEHGAFCICGYRAEGWKGGIKGIALAISFISRLYLTGLGDFGYTQNTTQPNNTTQLFASSRNNKRLR